jgi:hypothetical protein
MKMKLNHVLSKGLITLALLSSISLLSVMPAKAVPFDYNVIGGVTGSFNADISDLTSSFLNWSLQTPTHLFVPADLGVNSNDNLVLFQSVGVHDLTFAINTLSNTYTAIYSGGPQSSGVINGTFELASTNGSVPEAGTYLLLLAGLGIVGLAARYRMFA